MKKEAIELLQWRIQQEQQSSKIYEQMAYVLEDKSFFGAAKLWKKYAAEELEHAEWAADYLLSFNVTPELRKLEQPVNDYPCLVDIINATLEHETLITQQCNDLVTKAQELGDHNLCTLGLKYCEEQINEMAKAYNLVTLLDTFGTDKIALKLLDEQLGDF